MGTTKRTPKRKTARSSRKAPPPKKPKPRARPRKKAADRKAALLLLGAAIPGDLAKVELDFVDPWQLLIATILAAQSTDRTVNRVTPALFRRFPRAEALAAADPAEVEALVYATGFFRSKARAIMSASRQLVEQHDGRVPATIDELVELPGVARKTANVVLANAFGKAEGVVVDRHASRVAERLGWTREQDPVDIEQGLMAAFSKSDWIGLGQRLVLHGRYVCTARKPRCEACPLNELCPSAESPPSPEASPPARATLEAELIETRRAADGPKPEEPEESEEDS
jgi:endonuclease-3